MQNKFKYFKIAKYMQNKFKNVKIGKYMQNQCKVHKIAKYMHNNKYKKFRIAIYMKICIYFACI